MAISNVPTTSPTSAPRLGRLVLQVVAYRALHMDFRDPLGSRALISGDNEEAILSIDRVIVRDTPAIDATRGRGIVKAIEME